MRFFRAERARMESAWLAVFAGAQQMFTDCGLLFVLNVNFDKPVKFRRVLTVLFFFFSFWFLYSDKFLNVYFFYFFCFQLDFVFLFMQFLYINIFFNSFSILRIYDYATIKTIKKTPLYFYFSRLYYII